MRFLGIDYGKVNVGLAVADEEVGIAFSSGTLKNGKGFFKRLLDFIDEEGISIVVIGIPSYINRSEIIYAGERLADRIRKARPVKVEFQNEMFSTQLARRNLREVGARNMDMADDTEAARIILQSWLEKGNK